MLSQSMPHAMAKTLCVSICLTNALQARAALSPSLGSPVGVTTALLFVVCVHAPWLHGARICVLGVVYACVSCFHIHCWKADIMVNMHAHSLLRFKMAHMHMFVRLQATTNGSPLIASCLYDLLTDRNQWITRDCKLPF